MKRVKDYAIVMRDSAGRQILLHITGDSVNEAIRDGGFREDVESNAFANAIARGEIGEDAIAVERITAGSPNKYRGSDFS